MPKYGKRTIISWITSFGKRAVFMVRVVLLRRKIPPETQEKLLLRRKIFCAMSLMTELTLALTLSDPQNDV